MHNPGEVARTRAQLIDVHDAVRLAELFRLLADPNRARLLHALVGPAPVLTLDRYGHLFDQAGATAAQTVGDLLRRARVECRLYAVTASPMSRHRLG